MSYRRRMFLINKGFQLRFSFYVCSWLIALSFGYPLIISNLFDYLIRYLAQDPMGPLLTELISTRKDLLWLLIIMQVVFLLITFLISIFMSHRIAGPLYKLRMFFQQAKAGNLDQRLAFRKRDYFHEIATEYNEMMDSIRGRMIQKDQSIERAISALEKAKFASSTEISRNIDAALSALLNKDQT